MKNLSKAILALTTLAAETSRTPEQICCACERNKRGLKVPDILKELLGERNALTIIRLAKHDIDRNINECGVYLDKVLEVICILLKGGL